MSEPPFDEVADLDFFQAVRLLEARGRAAGRAPVGRDAPTAREAVRLRVLPALAFPEGPVARVESDGDGAEPPTLSVSFLGLTGPQGVLPQHYTALVLARMRRKDATLRDFLDLFHHRILSLFFRAWERNRLPFAHERSRADPAAGEDAGTRALYSLAGMGTGGLRGRCGFPDEAVLFYAGLFARQPRTGIGLEQLLRDYFGWPVRLRQFVGQWLLLDRENQTRLPGAQADGANTRLGSDAVIGRRVWDVQGKVEITVGPLPYAAFHAMLPRGELRPYFRQWVRLYLGMELDVAVRVLPLADEAPWCELRHDEEHGPRLGWNTWARSHNFGMPPSEAVFPLDEEG